MTSGDMTVAIPTYQRESVLIDTLEALARLGAAEILVVDQTPEHEPRTTARMRELSAGLICWLQLDRAALPHAMNVALVEARHLLARSLDDDIQWADDRAATHSGRYGDPDTWAVAGQVLQPGEISAPARSRFRTTGLRAFWRTEASTGLARNHIG